MWLVVWVFILVNVVVIFEDILCKRNLEVEEKRKCSGNRSSMSFFYIFLSNVFGISNGYSW